MKNTKTILAIILLLSVMSTVKSQVTSIYFLKNIYYRHELNPAFQPASKSFVDLPIIPTLQVEAGNNSLSLSDVIYPKEIDGKMQTITFMHPEGDKDKFYETLFSPTNVFVEPRVDLLSFGFRSGNNGYVTFGVSQKTNATFSLPKDMFKLLLYGTPDTLNTNIYDFTSLGVKGSSYTEVAFGYSHKVTKHLTVGAKVKYLVGLADISSHFNNVQLRADRDRWQLIADGYVNAGIAFADYKIDEETKQITDFNINTNNLLSPSGTGFAFDVGATYNLFDRLELSASLLDLGSLKWNKNVLNFAVNSSVTFEGVEYDPNEENQDKFFEEYGKALADSLQYTTSHIPSYTSKLQSKVLLGAEFYLLKNFISIGVLSKMPLNLKTSNSEVSLFANFYPSKILNASVSYSLIHGKYRNIGVGLGAKLGPLNFFIAGDYIPFTFAPNYIPVHTKTVNLNMGLAIAIR